MTQKSNNAESEVMQSAPTANAVNGHGGADSAALLKQLAAEFPRSQISWRAQSLTKDGDKAMALAYIDARDVFDRLNQVCGAHWQCRYPHADKKTVCEIGIKIDGEWIWRANGAGDSDVEAEKGAMSDAFKRAAVMWGIGRYLYDIDSPWVPCKTYEKNGKKVWSGWNGDPWASIRGLKAEQKVLDAALEERLAKAREVIAAAKDEAALKKVTGSKNYQNLLSDVDGTPHKNAIMNFVTERFDALFTPAPSIAGTENLIA